MLKAELKVSGGTHAGRTIPLAKQRFLIGRGEDCQLRPASEQISRHHCVFSIDEFTVRLRDLGSTNGTFVNEEPLHGEVILKHGDAVRVGALAFEMQISDEQVQYDSGEIPHVSPLVLPTELLPDTAELAIGDTALNLPAAGDTQNAGSAAASSDTTLIPAAADQTSSTEETAIHTDPTTPMDASQIPQGQPYPQQPPGGMPYPQAPYPYPPPPGMGYPPQPYGYPGYMPMPGQYPQPMPQYAMPGQYPPQPEMPAQETATGSAVDELPVKLPAPEETGAREPEPKPEPVAEEGGEPAKKDPSTFAAEAIRNMKTRRPGMSSN